MEQTNSQSREVDPDRSVYVCNIPYDHDWKALKNVFNSKVGKVTYVNKLKDGCALIEFSTGEIALQAIGIMNRFSINGRKIVVKKSGKIANPKLGTKAPSEAKNSVSSSKRVFVSNIPYNFKSKELKALFKKKVGEVTSVDIVKEGCAFIEFKNSDNVPKAIKTMNKHEVGKRKIIVKEESKGLKEIPSFAPGLMPEPLCLDSNRLINTNPYNLMPSALKPSPLLDSRLLGYIPNKQPADIAPFACNINDTFNNTIMNRLGNNGYASAFKPNTKIISPFESDSGHSIRNAGYGNTYGLSVDFLKSKGIVGPLVSRVFFANMYYKLDEECLRELFETAGTVLNIHLKKSNDGKSKGFGYVDYEHPVEAVQAISMLNDQLYFNRKISLKMCTESQNEEVNGMRSGNMKTFQTLPKGLQSLGMGLGSSGAPMKNVTKIMAHH